MLATERQIQRVLTGYAHALDRHDWDAVPGFDWVSER